MRKIFKTAVAAIATTAMVASLFVGYVAPVNAAAGNALEGAVWEKDYQSWEGSDVAILNSTFEATETGFTTNITTTGWQRQWAASCPEDGVVVGDGWMDNPYQLRARTTVAVAAGATYQFSVTINNAMLSEAGAPTEKNVLVTISSGIQGDTDNIMLNECFRIPANSTETFTREFTVSPDYIEQYIMIEFAYGAFCYSYEVEKAGMTAQITNPGYLYAPGTTEAAACKGVLTFSDISMVGEVVEVESTEKPTLPPMETTANNLSNPQQQQQVTVAPTTQAPTTTKATGKKPGKVKIKSAKNVKGKKVKITWKKVTGAKKYQVKVGSKKKTTSKLSYTMKGLKKNKKYKVNVRAKNSAGYGKWSKTKKVTIKK